MAERRMFAKTIVTSDAFLDMPLSARCLYFTLGMFADDDGFVNAPKSIMRQVGASVDDLNVLLAKQFVITFESGVIVIKHWRINNYLRTDRYVETKYKEEKNRLNIEANGSYTLNDVGTPVGIPMVHQRYTQDSIGKDSIGKYTINTLNTINNNNKNSIYKEKNVLKREKFTPPTVEEVQTYCSERHNTVDAERFVDFYEAKGWMIGKNAMKDWKAAVRTWERKDKEAHRGEENGEDEDDIDYSVYNVKR